MVVISTKKNKAKKRDRGASIRNFRESLFFCLYNESIATFIIAKNDFRIYKLSHLVQPPPPRFCRRENRARRISSFV